LTGNLRGWLVFTYWAIAVGMGIRLSLPLTLITTGRHDPCVGIRAVPIAEAMLAITLMDHYLRNRGQNADVDSGLKPI